MLQTIWINTLSPKWMFNISICEAVFIVCVSYLPPLLQAPEGARLYWLWRNLMLLAYVTERAGSLIQPPAQVRTDSRTDSRTYFRFQARTYSRTDSCTDSRTDSCTDSRTYFWNSWFCMVGVTHLHPPPGGHGLLFWGFKTDVKKYQKPWQKSTSGGGLKRVRNGGPEMGPERIPGRVSGGGVREG